MSNVDALKALYVAFGGEAATVASCTLNVEVLNAISALFSGASDAELISDAINNIAAVAEAITTSGCEVI